MSLVPISFEDLAKVVSEPEEPFYAPLPEGAYVVKLSLNDLFEASPVVDRTTMRTGREYKAVLLKAAVITPRSPWIPDETIGRFIFHQVTTIPHRGDGKTTSDIHRLLRVLGVDTKRLKSDEKRIEALSKALACAPVVGVYVRWQAYSRKHNRVVLGSMAAFPRDERGAYRYIIEHDGEVIRATNRITQFVGITN